MVELRDRFETTDGSRPDARALDDAVGKAHPLVAFAVLAGGDAFEGKARPPDPHAASAWSTSHLVVERHGAAKDTVAQVQREAAHLLAHNPHLQARMARQKQIVIDLVPEGHAMARYGFPACVYEGASGLFWDHPTWPQARVALRQEWLPRDPVLVTHELAHAVHALAFTTAERALIYDVLRPTFGSRSAMDEVFAIYAEAEFLPSFTDDDKKAPGIYGHTRRQWSEDHLFTRFVRKLWFPGKPLAGPKMGGPGGASSSSWRKFSGGR